MTAVPIDPLPIPIPTGHAGPTIQPSDIPNIPGTIIHKEIAGAVQTWDDVANAVSSGWHSVTGWFTDAVSTGSDAIKTLLDNAINYSITGLSTEINNLEGWAVGSIDKIVFAIDSNVDAISADLSDLWSNFGVFGDAILDGLSGIISDYIARITAVETFTAGAIDALRINIEGWAIDNIYHPLLNDVHTLEHDVLVGVAGVEADIKSWTEDLVHEVNAETLAKLAAVAAAVAAITTWVDDCGEPMCAEIGPKTNAGKLLSNLQLQALLAALLALTLGDPKAVADAVEVLVSAFGPVLEHTVTDWLVPLQAATPG